VDEAQKVLVPNRHLHGAVRLELVAGEGSLADEQSGQEGDLCVGQTREASVRRHGLNARQPV
jgi:hypothetical protein